MSKVLWALGLSHVSGIVCTCSWKGASSGLGYTLYLRLVYKRRNSRAEVRGHLPLALLSHLSCLHLSLPLFFISCSLLLSPYFPALLLIPLSYFLSSPPFVFPLLSSLPSHSISHGNEVFLSTPRMMSASPPAPGDPHLCVDTSVPSHRHAVLPWHLGQCRPLEQQAVCMIHVELLLDALFSFQGHCGSSIIFGIGEDPVEGQGLESHHCVLQDMRRVQVFTGMSEPCF